MGGRGWGCWRPPPHHQPPHFLEEPGRAHNTRKAEWGVTRGTFGRGVTWPIRAAGGPEEVSDQGKWTISPAAWPRAITHAPQARTRLVCL